MEHQGERRVSEGKQRETKQVQGETKGNEIITKGIPRKHLGNFGKLCSFRLKGFRLKRLFGSGTFSHSGIFRPDRTHKSILSRKNLEPNTFSARELVWLGKEEIFADALYLLDYSEVRCEILAPHRLNPLWLHQVFPATFRKLRNSATLMEFNCFVMSWNGINF